MLQIDEMVTPGWEPRALDGLWERANNNGGFGSGNDDDDFSGAFAGMGFRAQGGNGSRFLNQLIFANVRSIRMSTIILASFNVIAAFATAVGILWDCYLRRKRNDPRFQFLYGIYHAGEYGRDWNADFWR